MGMDMGMDSLEKSNPQSPSVDNKIHSLHQLTQVSQQPPEASFQGTLGPNLQGATMQHVMNIVAPAKQKNSHLSDWETEFWKGMYVSLPLKSGFRGHLVLTCKVLPYSML